MVMAAIGHFTFQREEFQAQVPGWLPFSKDFVVIASGAIEAGLGLALIFWQRRRAEVGLALAVFLCSFFQPVLILWALWPTGAPHRLIRSSNQNQ
ncbi:hypothetical protein FRY97_00780 [Phaeodactylibacter luteus]|uniref:DoxX family membrane protein n=1 Tax=Phaeodactylibacter luteus TaxID=1564516 RepID=A0A5C6S9P5_9BACT|nr:hypothetical protein FRY97_00780 [Phaeodactylibacter luteus]